MLPEHGASVIALVPIRQAWERLGGGPLRGGRAAAFWRRSDSLNITLDRERNVWYDFAHGTGGGVLDLVQTVRACNRQEAVCWLRAEGLLLDEAPSENRRQQAHRRAELDRASHDIGYWRLGRIAQLERVKEEALACCEDAALSASATELYQLQSDGGAVVAAYQEHARRDPDGAAALIAWARDDEYDAQRTTAAIVLMLAATEVRG